MDSILTSIKRLLGIAEEYDHFDPELVIHINSVFMILTQMGVGPAEGFRITGAEETWDDFIPDGKNLESVKSYVYMKVRLMFDTPTSSSLMDALTRSISEFEWRLNIAAESD